MYINWQLDGLNILFYWLDCKTWGASGATIVYQKLVAFFFF